MNAKIKESIWEIAEKNGLGYIVVGYGVDRIWELMQDELHDDIFTPYSEVCLDVLKELCEPSYYNHDLNAVWCDYIVIAIVYGHNEVRVLQGTPRNEVIKKIIKDCPYFASYHHLTENYYPKLFSEETGITYAKQAS